PALARCFPSGSNSQAAQIPSGSSLLSSVSSFGQDNRDGDRFNDVISRRFGGVSQESQDLQRDIFRNRGKVQSSGYRKNQLGRFRGMKITKFPQISVWERVALNPGASPGLKSRPCVNWSKTCCNSSENNDLLIETILK